MSASIFATPLADNMPMEHIGCSSVWKIVFEMNIVRQLQRYLRADRSSVVALRRCYSVLKSSFHLKSDFVDELFFRARDLYVICFHSRTCDSLN